MAKIAPEILAHLEWIGFVRPTGLVVSAPALVKAGAILDRRDAEGQRLLRECVPPSADASDDTAPTIGDFPKFARAVLGWDFGPNGYAGTAEQPIPSELVLAMPDDDTVLKPDYAVRELDPRESASPWQLLVTVLPDGCEFDVVQKTGTLEATPLSRMERLLRDKGVPAGLLCNGATLRLVSAPRGESSGWLEFDVASMVVTAGRPICTAMRLLLSQTRLLALPRAQRLAALLDDSRKFQNEVSERLAQQVLHALYELLRGFQAAHDASKGTLLREPLADDPDEVYRALLTVILRLVFLLYAEERDLLPEDEIYLQHYSLAGLYERLREDAVLYPDTMDQRFGAWAQLLVLFRMVFDGAEVGEMRLPRRHGALFDPDRFEFLEGRVSGARQIFERVEPPLVPDGTIYRALDKLLVLDGERISYRALDVEQIGSVYETMMGFRLETAYGRSITIRAPKPHGAPSTIDLEALLTTPAAQREKWLKEHTDRKPSDTVKKAVKAAITLDDLHAALGPIIDAAASPDLIPPGAMVLQPSPERRRSGSHYTPRSLTEPIVRTTLRPILERLAGPDGVPPRADVLLDLKICDPAMGSGAFLVEACRQLGSALVESWKYHGDQPQVPADEDELVYAMRLVAQRCLYGVDRNPVAVDLAKVSLWLATLARDHALTFVDHALRHGDSLVGLSRRQLESFHWLGDKPKFEAGMETVKVREHLSRAVELRAKIRDADDSVTDRELHDLWYQAEQEMIAIRRVGDLVVKAYFDGDGAKDRDDKRIVYANAIVNGNADQYDDALAEGRSAIPPHASFHWEIEFPEVFDRANPGFDAFVGNPPFGGKNTVAAGNLEHYGDWLKQTHAESHGNADLVAHFYRRAFDLLRADGTFGLIATNTIAQGDTRSTGLRWICTHGGEIYEARKRVRWPGGAAAVIVSVVHVVKGSIPGRPNLDGKEVDTITAFLFHRGGHDDPVRLVANTGKSFQGSIVLGMGFTFDDTDTSGVASSLADMHRLIEKDPRNAEVIFPYIGGEEVNTSPTHAHHRYVIDFGERSEEECRKRWPDLIAIVETRVKPERLKQNDKGAKQKWWQFIRPRPELRAAIANLDRVLVVPRMGNHLSVVALEAKHVLSDQLVVLPLEVHRGLGPLQSRTHEVWVRTFSSTMGDGLRYTPSDCFETFPFPESWETSSELEGVGVEYYDHRVKLMVANDEGLTKTYNRFHDPEERDAGILRLRELHAEMDRAVLDAYGWSNIPTECEFLLDYEEDDDESGSKRKKPWRYRWPDEVRDEVLARLLELNAERAAEEARSGAAAAKRTKSRKAPKSGNTKELF